MTEESKPAVSLITFHGDKFDPNSKKTQARLAALLATAQELALRAEPPSPGRLSVRATTIL